jgi:hypothetical protein
MKISFELHQVISACDLSMALLVYLLHDNAIKIDLLCDE